MKKLFQSINKRDFQTVKNLIDKNPELVNCKSVGLIKRDEGQTPLRVAIKNSCYEIVEYLINKGAEINVYTPEDGSSIIHQAVYTVLRRSIPSTRYAGTFEDSFKIFKLLLSKNIDLTIRNKYNWSCFQDGLGISRGCVHSISDPSDLPDDKEWCEKVKSVLKPLIDKGVDTSLTKEWKEYIGFEGFRQWRLNILMLCEHQEK